MDKNQDQSIMDKSMRSVFVGNIPYEATEEKLKDIFSEVGPVISLKLVFDRESGKPKGYGFCEYKDQETALSAMRNLNGYEIGGRTLRVDNACTEKSRMEMAALLQGPQVDNPYGDSCEPEQAPEIITKTVASLPPEQMFELMKQMKSCIQNNPVEARQMLIHNPQLAYALLQAQVVMKILDPATALTFLQRGNEMPPVLTSQSVMNPASITGVGVNVPQPVPPISSFQPLGNDIDLRDPRLSRQMPPQVAPNLGMDQDLRSMTMDFGRGQPPVQAVRQPAVQPFVADPRQRPADPRTKVMPPSQQAQVPTMQQIQRGAGIPNDASDQEKAQLIMQVLQLTEEQIRMLPQEQRNSILLLKDQIAKSAQR
ncbi:cleavage stimulation factor subunit 2 [Culicoides brevitarsis]|uniref:cleavage stimulation factor subunit 2 n=1 Tax=Culicoides brevitarsis TaxID=469753 RepID=UPI00307B1CB8